MLWLLTGEFGVRARIVTECAPVCVSLDKYMAVFSMLVLMIAFAYLSQAALNNISETIQRVAISYDGYK